MGRACPALIAAGNGPWPISRSSRKVRLGLRAMPSRRSGSPILLAPGGALDRRSLASVKPTDVLVLGIQTWPVGVSAVPLRVEGRASLYSLGFLLRRAAAVRLDIHERELKVGLLVIQDANGQVVGQTLISDSLENGAGYSSYFGTPVEAESLLRFVWARRTTPRFSARSWRRRIRRATHRTVRCADILSGLSP